MKKVLLIVLAILVLVGLLGSCMSGGNEEPSSTRKESTSASTSAQTNKNESKTTSQSKSSTKSSYSKSYSSSSSKSKYSTSSSTKKSEPASTTTKAEESAADATKTTEKTSSYIGNKNTKKFHYEWCSSVGQMKESNKYYYTGTRDEMIAKGYVPCQKCNP